MRKILCVFCNVTKARMCREIMIVTKYFISFVCFASKTPAVKTGNFVLFLVFTFHASQFIPVGKCLLPEFRCSRYYFMFSLAKSFRRLGVFRRLVLRREVYEEQVVWRLNPFVLIIRLINDEALSLFWACSLRCLFIILLLVRINSPEDKLNKFLFWVLFRIKTNQENQFAFGRFYNYYYYLRNWLRLILIIM